jgi:hypothetical protein
MPKEINSEENKTEAPPAETTTQTVETQAEPAAPAAPAAGARKNDPWKTAFIVLAGISVISAGVFYLNYGRNKNDLPTAPAADPNAQPVQMANPPTGASEQTALRQPLPQVVGNAADMGAGGPGGYDPWANPGKFQSNSSSPYQVVPTSPPGQQMYMESNPNSPFMQDGNTYIMVPSNSNAAVNANKGVPNANKARPTSSPLPMPGVTPAVINPPGQSNPPASNKPAAAPANKPSRPLKKSGNTGKPSGT